MINFDEWGGFFEHVAPSAAPIPPADAAAGNRDGLRGFRVPCLIISPRSRRGYVAGGGIYDHTSVLNMIEWRWNLRPLTIRDASARNLALALDFSLADLAAQQYAVPPGPFGTACIPWHPCHFLIRAPQVKIGTVYGTSPRNMAGLSDRRLT